MEKEAIRQKIEELAGKQQWNHQIELPFGLKTKQIEQNLPGKNLVKWKHIEPLMKKLLKGKNILDIGCNDGFFSTMCSELGAEHVTGVDIDPLRIEKAQFIKEVKELKKVDFINTNVFEDKAYKEKKYDIALCLGFLHRIPDPVSLISSICGISDIIVFEWKYFPYDVLLKNISYFEPVRKGKNYERFNDPYFLLSFSALEEILKRNGFTYYYRRHHGYRRAFLVASKKSLDINEFTLKMPFGMRLFLFLSLVKSALRGLLFAS